MCPTCGCGEADVRVEALADHEHPHEHPHDHEHAHDHHPHDHSRDHSHSHDIVEIETALLAKNDQLAQHNRGLAGRAGHRRAQPDELAGVGQDVTAGAHDPRARRRRRPVAVIEGDQETDHDAERIRAHRRAASSRSTPAPGCHLDADMVARGAARARRRRPARWCSSRTSATSSARRSSTSASAQGGRRVGHRGRGQAAQVPAHVPRGADSWSSTRSTCCRTSTSSSSGWPPTAGRSIPTSRSCRYRSPPVTAWMPGVNGWPRAGPWPSERALPKIAVVRRALLDTFREPGVGPLIAEQAGRRSAPSTPGVAPF